MTADRRAAHTDDKRAHSPFANSENASRAALVEKVARAMEKADSHAYEYQLTSSWEHLAEAAIALIRAETLEEAARVVTEHYQELCTEHRLLLVNRAAAIRALVNKNDVDETATK